MSYHFNDKEVLSELSRIFYKIDKDSDGKISKNDLFVAYNEIGEKISKEEMDNIIKSVDFDKNGFIEYEEFVRVLIPEEKLFTEENLKNAFALFDTDKNGFITPTQIINVLEKDEIISEKAKLMLKDEIKKIIGNDIIKYENFKNILVAQKEAEKKQQLAAQAEQDRKQKAIEAAQQDTTALFYQALSGTASKVVLKNEKPHG